MQHPQLGRYENLSHDAEQVRALIPDPLPPKVPVNMTQLQKLLDFALVALGRLDSITTLLPDPLFYLSAYIRREAVLSSRIEGTVSTISEVLQFELSRNSKKSTNDDLIEVANYANALAYGAKRMSVDDFPLSNRLIKELHARLLQSGRGSQKDPGQFRRSQNWIGGTHPGNAHFVPPPPHHVEECMSDLEKFIHADIPSMSGLIKTGLVHAQFETIHPFLDGNGRVGRLLIALQLQHEGLLKQPLLYISLYINKHRDRYYQLLDEVRSEGRWEGWLAFYLTAISETANDAVSVAKQLSSLFAKDQERIRKFGAHKGSALKIHRIFQSTPIQTISNIAKLTGLTYPAVANGVKLLEKSTIVKELTGKQRYRIYAYSDNIALLSDDSPTER